MLVLVKHTARSNNYFVLFSTKEEIQRRIGGEQVLIQEQDELETKKITKVSIRLNLLNKMLYWLTIRSTQIFWFTIFTFVLWLIFIERFYSEHQFFI